MFHFVSTLRKHLSNVGVHIGLQVRNQERSFLDRALESAFAPFLVSSKLRYASSMARIASIRGCASMTGPVQQSDQKSYPFDRLVDGLWLISAAPL